MAAPSVSADTSRMEMTYGDALKLLRRMSTLVVGLRGVGAECAKNLALATLHSLTLYDPRPVELTDLSLNFFLRPEDVGKRLDECTARGLAELKAPEMKLSILAPRGAALAPSDCAGFHCCVFTDGRPLAGLAAYDAFCRATPQPTFHPEERVGGSTVFLAGGVLGIAGWAFSDFGPSHVITDSDGSALLQLALTKLTPLTPAEAGEQGLGEGCGACVRLDFAEPLESASALDGESVRLTRAPADWLAALGGRPLRVLATLGVRPHAILVQAPPGAALPAAYHGNADATTVKVPHAIACASLAHCLEQATAEGAAAASGAAHPIFVNDHAALRGGQDALAALAALECSGGVPPPLRDAGAARRAAALLQPGSSPKPPALLAGHLAGNAEWEISKGFSPDAVTTVLATARAELPAVSTLIGSILAQEVVKVTGKFTPNASWFGMCDVGVLPPQAIVTAAAGGGGDAGAGEGGAAASASAAPPSDEFAPRGLRTDGLTAILGRTAQARVEGARVFCVGAGALGCEYMKSFALASVGCPGAGGGLVITDMDRIEPSNLSRQFLFRGHDVGKPKSTTAAAAACAANAALAPVRALEAKLWAGTEQEPFGDAFWGGLDLVMGSLDNTAARNYLDARCRFFGLPWVNAGTLGLSGSATPHIPFQTGHYFELDASAGGAQAIAMCTLRNFPYLPVHCMEWAKDYFEKVYALPFRTAVALGEDAAATLAALRAATGAGTGAKEAFDKLSSTLAVLELAGAVRETAAAVAGGGAAADAARRALLQRLARHAREEYDAAFVHRIQQLTEKMPENWKDPKTGKLFWAPPLRFPTTPFFGAQAGGGAGGAGEEGGAHDASFVRAHVTILARGGLQCEALLPADWLAACVPAAAGAAVPAFVYSDNPDAVPGEAAAAALARLEALVAAGGAVGVREVEFEKDDPANGHVESLTAVTNVRSATYGIPESSAFKVRTVIGNIMAAVATCTAATTGLGMLELYKLLQKKPVEAHFETNISMASALFNWNEAPSTKRGSAALGAVTLERVHGGVKGLFALGRHTVPPRFSPADKFVVRGGALTLANGVTPPPSTPLAPTAALGELEAALGTLLGFPVSLDAFQMNVRTVAGADGEESTKMDANVSGLNPASRRKRFVDLFAAALTPAPAGEGAAGAGAARAAKERADRIALIQARGYLLFQSESPKGDVWNVRAAAMDWGEEEVLAQQKGWAAYVEEAKREQASALALFDAEMAAAAVDAPEKLAGAQERRSILEGQKEPASGPIDVYSSPPLVFYFD